MAIVAGESSQPYRWRGRPAGWELRLDIDPGDFGPRLIPSAEELPAAPTSEALADPTPISRIRQHEPGRNA